ncbi:MAG: patatin-like phospholipase family protein [Bacteroidetes bacterium]|nr:patatin-like phospholipase family protein [Bacteroidota bacterium]
MSLRKLALLFLLVICCASAHSQKVALILSGGASKGGAHIGVLRALEEQHIPISFIAGTSVGAIIGGLYASGYTPDEIEALISSEEFQKNALGLMYDEYVYYYRKEEPNASWISMDINPKKKLTSSLPTNLKSPFMIDFRFMELFSPANAAAGGDFDKLFVPFRCVVADIDSSSAVIVKQGDLSSAIRASMSIPFVYNPVILNNKLMYDGGMYNNFPTNVAADDFKADVIIGSRVAERYDKPDPEDIVSQLLIMLMGKQSSGIPYPNSVLILPNVPSVDLLDFGHTRTLADSGYAAAMRKIPAIRKLVHDSVSAEDLIRRREAFKNSMPGLVFDSIITKGLTRSQNAYVKQVLKHGRELVNLDELRPEYYRFIDEGFVKTIYPGARFNSRTGHYDLLLDIRTADKFSVDFGGNLSLGTVNEAFLELRYKYLWNKALHFLANGYFGKFYASAKLGARVDFNSKYPWYIDLNYTYNHFDYFKNATFFFDDKTPSYIIEREYFGDLCIGLPITNSGKLGIDLTYAFTNNKYYQSNQFSRYDTADQTGFNFLAPSVCFDLNNLNRKQYASAGARLRISLSYINGIEDFLPGSTSTEKNEIENHHDWFCFRLLYDNYFNSFGPVKLGFYGEAVVSNQALFSNYVSSLIHAPAFQPVPESQTLILPNFRALSYAGAGLKVIIRVYKKIEYRLEGYLFQPYQEILEDPDNHTASLGPVFSKRSVIGSTSFVYNSPLGPISLGVNYYDKSPDSFHLNLNFGFIIFNRRAMP